MRNRKKDLPVIGVEGITEYVNSSNEIRNRHFVFMPDGVQLFCIKGQLIPIHEVDNKPSQLRKKAVFKGNNLDGRSNWIE